jgi:hypothetical protein
VSTPVATPMLCKRASPAHFMFVHAIHHERKVFSPTKGGLHCWPGVTARFSEPVPDGVPPSRVASHRGYVRVDGAQKAAVCCTAPGSLLGCGHGEG